MAFIHRELRSLLTADTQHHCSQTDFNERMFRGIGNCDPKTAHKLPALTPKDPQPQEQQQEKEAQQASMDMQQQQTNNTLLNQRRCLGCEF